jgi:hypothetical protein
MDSQNDERIEQPKTAILNISIPKDIVVLVRLTSREREWRLSAHLSSTNRALKDEFICIEEGEEDPNNLDFIRFQFPGENISFKKSGIIIIKIEIIGSHPYGSECLRAFYGRIDVIDDVAATNTAGTNGAGTNGVCTYTAASLPEEAI